MGDEDVGQGGGEHGDQGGVEHPQEEKGGQ